MAMQAPKVEETKDKAIGFGSLDVMKEESSWSKICNTLHQGKNCLVNNEK
jgi:hypothetical protein